MTIIGYRSIAMSPDKNMPLLRTRGSNPIEHRVVLVESPKFSTGSLGVIVGTSTCVSTSGSCMHAHFLSGIQCYIGLSFMCILHPERRYPILTEYCF